MCKERGGSGGRAAVATKRARAVDVYRPRAVADVHNKSGFKCVKRTGEARWNATVNDKYLGSFGCPVDAAVAVDNATVELFLHGETI